MSSSTLLHHLTGPTTLPSALQLFCLRPHHTNACSALVISYFPTFLLFHFHTFTLSHFHTFLFSHFHTFLLSHFSTFHFPTFLLHQYHHHNCSDHHCIGSVLEGDPPAGDDMPKQHLPQGLLVPQKPIKCVHWHLENKYITNI